LDWLALLAHLETLVGQDRLGSLAVQAGQGGQVERVWLVIRVVTEQLVSEDSEVQQVSLA